MAGTLSGFDADTFRTSITNTMVMGLPNDDTLKPTFYFRSTSTYPPGTKLDPSGKPIDARMRPTVTSLPPVQVPCAVEYQQDTSNNESLVGTLWTDRATVTVLDIHYDTIKDAIEVELSGKRYMIQQMTSVGLGPVTVYQLQCYIKGSE